MKSGHKAVLMGWRRGKQNIPIIVHVNIITQFALMYKKNKIATCIRLCPGPMTPVTFKQYQSTSICMISSQMSYNTECITKLKTNYLS